MKNKQINGFIVLPLKFSATSTASHDLFIKEHHVRKQSSETPSGRTLFVLNVPPYATEESFQRIFSTVGPVENVIFKNSPNDNDEQGKSGFKMAYVVYTRLQSLQNALKLKSLEPLSTPETPIILGMQRWTQAYNNSIPDPKDLQKEIDDFMTNYDRKIEREKKQEELAAEKDDDGWTTVTKNSRKPGLSRKEIVEQKIKEKLERTKKKKELKNFYTFQIRDSKMKHLATLRKKFEEDKKKITLLKQTRRFKPF